MDDIALQIDQIDVLFGLARGARRRPFSQDKAGGFAGCAKPFLRDAPSLGLLASVTNKLRLGAVVEPV
jgi:hypothetical protein